MHEPMIIRVTFLAGGVVGLLFGLFFLLAAEQSITSFELGAPDGPCPALRPVNGRHPGGLEHRQPGCGLRPRVARAIRAA